MVDDELLAWYEEHYPNNSLNWIVDKMLRKFREYADSNTPKLHIEMAIEELEIEGTLKNG